MRVHEPRPTEPYEDRASCHEAAHAATALLLGYEVEELRIDRPEPGSLGHCVTPRAGRPLDLGDLAITLAGGMVDGGAGSTDLVEWPPRWPLLPDRGDGERVRQIVKALRVSREIYEQVVAMTEDLVRSAEFKPLFKHLAVALRRAEILSGEEIKRIAAPFRQPEVEPCSTH